MRRLLCAVAGLLVAAGNAMAQCAKPANISLYNLTDAHAELVQALSVTSFASANASPIARNSVRDVHVCADSISYVAPWSDRSSSAAAITMAPPVFKLTSNSAYARGDNDGALWAGKGINTEFRAGARARWRALSIGLYPTLIYQQNADFQVPFARNGYSSFTNPYHLLDYPLRMGDRSWSGIDPGQSFIRADYKSAYIAFSTENLWLGPTHFYSLLLSNAAQGFPHLRVGTSRPVRLPIVDFGFSIFGGSVDESPYFDGVAYNDSHFFTATALFVQPHVLPGLNLGIARVYHDTAHAAGQPVSFYLKRLAESPLFSGGGNRVGNGIGALYFRWVLPESGFEFYGEWARDDTPYNLEDILREPDWTAVWSAGFQKVYVRPQRITRVFGEVVRLGASTATVRTGRGPVTFYTHGTVPQGHTQKGQMLGSWTGPGSDAQRVGFDTYDRHGLTGAYLERVRYDDDAYYATFARTYGEARHDVEATLGLRRVQFVDRFQLEGALALSRRYDRDFATLGADGRRMIENNASLKLTLRWNR